MAEGEFALVRRNLEAALNLSAASWVGEHDLYASLADAAGQQEDADALARFAPRAEATASRLGHPLYQAIAHRAWGVLLRLTGDFVASEARLNQALEIFARMGTDWQLGRTQIELGELYLRMGKPPQAQRAFGKAFSAYESVHAEPDLERARSLYAAAIAGSGDPGAKTGWAGAQTP